MVPPHEVFQCDCGYLACAQHDADIVVAAQAHARRAHGTELGEDLVLIMARPDEDGPSRPAQSPQKERRLKP